MRYRLGIETSTGDHWLAWVLDLPGCYSAGHTRAAAISNAGAAIAAYHQWIARHKAEKPFDDPYMDIHVTEVFQTTEPVPGVETRAFFDEDRMPLAEADVDAVQKLLSYTSRDLLSLCAPSGANGIPQPVLALLKQVTAEEWQYLDHLAMAIPQAELSDDPFQALDQIHGVMSEALAVQSGDMRVVTKNGELWSLRKVIRRMLWLERDRAQQITRLVSQ